MAGRFGAKVIELKVEAGKSFSLPELQAALKKHRPQLLFLTQGESSTGVRQSLAGVGAACAATGTLLLVDTVASLGGVPMLADAWGVDAVYTGSQKCLSAPPGAAPLMLNDRALAKVRGRKTKVRAAACAAASGWAGGWWVAGRRSSRRGLLAHCSSAGPRVLFPHMPLLMPLLLMLLPPRLLQVQSYYFDLNLVGDYWGWFGSRSYHHTGMVSECREG
jgi:aspartate aminotransferase-like enzyme